MASLYFAADILPARAGTRSSTMLTSSRRAPAPSRELQLVTRAALEPDWRSDSVEEHTNSMFAAVGLDVRRADRYIGIVRYIPAAR